MALSLGLILAFYGMIALGIHDFLGKLVLKKIKSFELLFLEYLFGIILLLPFLFFTKINFDVKSLYLIIIMGLLHVIAYFGLYGGFKIGKVSLLSPIAASYTISTLFLAYLFFNEKINQIQWFGVILAVAGIFLVSFEKVERIRLTKGLFLAFIPMISFALVFFLYKPLTSIYGFIFAVFLFKIITLLILTPKYCYSVKKIDKSLFLIILGIAILETSMQVSYSYSTLIEKISLTVPIINMYPAVVFILAFLFLKERLRLNQYIGLLLIIPAFILLSL